MRWFKRRRGRRPCYELATVSIQCGGETHRIDLTASGALIFRDHPDLGSERALIALGADCPDCLEVLHPLRYYHWGGPPWNRGYYPLIYHYDPILQRRIKAAEKIREKRRERRRRGDPLIQGLITRWTAWLQRFATDLGKHCRYVDADDQLKPLDFRVRVVWDAPKPRIEYASVQPFDDITIFVITRTWAAVWRRGLGVIDRCFVLELVEDGPEPLVLAGRPLDLGGVSAEPARVRDGRLEWCA